MDWLDIGIYSLVKLDKKLREQLLLRLQIEFQTDDISYDKLKKNYKIGNRHFTLEEIAERFEDPWIKKIAEPVEEYNGEIYYFDVFKEIHKNFNTDLKGDRPKFKVEDKSNVVKSWNIAAAKIEEIQRDIRFSQKNETDVNDIKIMMDIKNNIISVVKNNDLKPTYLNDCKIKGSFPFDYIAEISLPINFILSLNNQLIIKLLVSQTIKGDTYKLKIDAPKKKAIYIPHFTQLLPPAIKKEREERNFQFQTPPFSELL